MCQDKTLPQRRPGALDNICKDSASITSPGRVNSNHGPDALRAPLRGLANAPV